MSNLFYRALTKAVKLIVLKGGLKIMKKIFKKAVAILGSAFMIGATAGMAAAANFPAPFVEDGSANVAVVVGANAALSDAVAATNLGSDLASALAAQTAGTSGGTTIVSGTAWEVATSSDDLELGEAIYSVTNFIDSDDLSILADGEISNEKGTAQYEQFFYFEDQASSNVSYLKNDDDEIGLFFKIDDGNQIARYVMDFTTSLVSDSIAASRLEDIEDEEITLLGKSYTIIKAENKTSTATDGDVELTLMSGAAKGTVGNDEEVTVGGRTVSAVVSSATQVQLTIDGETTNKLNEGDSYKLSDDTYLGVADITYQDYAGGIQEATFYVGADKIELFNGSSMKVNSDTISDTTVEIESSMASGDVTITSVKVNMTAEDDLYIPVNGKLSEYADLAKPEVLFTQNWDIEFKGLEAHNTEELILSSTSSDEAMLLTFSNYNGDEIVLPLAYTNVSGVYPGEKLGKELILCANDSMDTSTNITKNDYFILNTADPTTSGNDARSFVVQYKGADKNSTTSPKYTFDILGVENGREISMTVITGKATIKIGGSSFSINPQAQSEIASKDAGIVLNGADYCDGALNASVSQYMRTKYNALINITDAWYNGTGLQESYASEAVSLYVNVSLDDTDRDGDDLVLNSTGKEQIFYVALVNGTSTDPDFATTFTGNSEWVTDPDDNNLKTFQTRYGATIEDVSASSAPDQVTVTIPDSIVRPLVYVSSGEISVSSTASSTGATELGSITVFDNEASAMSGKNLIVVGGSCINSVAADLLGSPACEAEFTALAGVSAGEALIKSFDKGGKVALLVAGYNAADTAKAVTYLTNNAVDTAVGSALKVTSATEATAITETA